MASSEYYFQVQRGWKTSEEERKEKKQTNKIERENDNKTKPVESI